MRTSYYPVQGDSSHEMYKHDGDRTGENRVRVPDVWQIHEAGDVILVQFCSILPMWNML